MSQNVTPFGSQIGDIKKYMHTFKLPGQQIPQPPLQQWSDAPHEEQPHSPAWSPEATAWTLANRTLTKAACTHREVKA